jgi:hypothetical protein
MTAAVGRPFRAFRFSSARGKRSVRRDLEAPDLYSGLVRGPRPDGPGLPVNAIPPPPLCGLTQNTVVIYYSDAARTHQICAEIVYPCTGGGSDNNCAGSRTPYTRTVCAACGVN